MPPPKTTAPQPADRAPGDTADAPVTLAVVIGAHGVAGEVRLKVFSTDLGAYKIFNDGALTLKSTRHGSNGTIARIAEVTDRNAAEAMRGTELTVPRSALPPLAEGEYYHTDLLGLPVVSTEGEPLGTVVAIDDFGAGDVIEVERPAVDGNSGKRFMVPMTADAVPDWNGERMLVDPAWIV
ncbi:ribosome maturation factor RimM [Sphingomonas hylomeconis]|uniref:Ribosome maturation factor RimM n=1 Tax=Sphingomonas hylomeconis TaxID=1395958 RepID=A0ABV7SX04_9SPHN|nr:ribosome maturation factor RimM [Sphingomonas hylomeconis]